MKKEDDGRRTRLLQARIAGQSGLVSRAQALLGGISADAIRWNIKSGRWITIQPGVYLTQPGRDDWQVAAVGALLFVGRPSALCGLSAAHAWGLVRDPGEDIEILVPYGRRQSIRSGIVTRRSRRFESRVDPLAWPHRTTVEHTVLDLCSRRNLDGAIALMARACQTQLADEHSLLQALGTRTRVPNRSLLVEALTDIGAGAHSAAEVRYVRDVERAHGLPVGLGQQPGLKQTQRDRTYDDTKVIVEIDGRRGHEGWTGRQRDGRRDRGAAATGWLTVRAFWIDVAVTPCDLAVELGAIFASRGWTGRVRPCRRAGCGARRVA